MVGTRHRAQDPGRTEGRDGQEEIAHAHQTVDGTAWEVFRGALGVIGLRGPAASLVHLIAVLGAEQALLPALGVATHTPCYGPKAVATDTLHHVVYAGASGLAYDHL